MGCSTWSTFCALFFINFIYAVPATFPFYILQFLVRSQSLDSSVKLSHLYFRPLFLFPRRFFLRLPLALFGISFYILLSFSEDPKSLDSSSSTCSFAHFSLSDLFILLSALCGKLFTFTREFLPSRWVGLVWLRMVHYGLWWFMMVYDGWLRLRMV